MVKERYIFSDDGFTLIELLVVIVIIAILAVVGSTIFNSIGQKTDDAKRRADVEAIAKAYESAYNPVSGLYPVLNGSEFSNNIIPTYSSGISYSGLLTAPDTGFRVCTPINGATAACNASSPDCFCKESIQGNYIASGITPSPSPSPIPSPTPSPSPIPSPSPSPSTAPSYQSGLLAYWKMDEGSWVNNCSTTYSLIDSVGTNNARSCPGVGPIPGIGQIGNGGVLDGVDDYLQTLTAPLNPSTGDFSVAFWVKLNASTGADQIFIAQGDGSFTTGRTWMGYRQGTGTQFSFLGGTFSFGTINFTLGSWHHAVLVRSGTSLTLYLDGVVDNSTIINSFENANGPLKFGSCKASGCYLKGMFDDMAIWNRGLTSGEVTQLYNLGIGGQPIL